LNFVDTAVLLPLHLSARRVVWRAGALDPVAHRQASRANAAAAELCENNCEGACDPFGKIHPHECLLCMNCLRACRQAQMTYGPNRSAAGESHHRDSHGAVFSRWRWSGLAAVPAVRLAGL